MVYLSTCRYSTEGHSLLRCDTISLVRQVPMFSSTPATCAESIQFAGRFIMPAIEASVLNPMVTYPVVAKIL
jgi:hypothetical protein